MRIFVVNATGQNKVFNYRLDYLVDEDGRKIVGTAKPYRTLTIPARQQIQLGGDWNPVQAQNIIEQLEEPAVGGVHVNNIRTAKAKGQVRLVWNQDKPVNRSICEDVFHHNVGFLSNEGERRRKNMALANSATADAANAQASSAFSVEVETVEADPDAVSPSIEAGYRVEKPKAGKTSKKGAR